jgi:hypothetical protein
MAFVSNYSKAWLILLLLLLLWRFGQFSGHGFPNPLPPLFHFSCCSLTVSNPEQVGCIPLYDSFPPIHGLPTDPPPPKHIPSTSFGCNSTFHDNSNFSSHLCPKEEKFIHIYLIILKTLIIHNSKEQSVL